MEFEFGMKVGFRMKAGSRMEFWFRMKSGLRMKVGSRIIVGSRMKVRGEGIAHVVGVIDPRRKTERKSPEIFETRSSIESKRGSLRSSS